MERIGHIDLIRALVADLKLRAGEEAKDWDNERGPLPGVYTRTRLDNTEAILAQAQAFLDFHAQPPASSSVNWAEVEGEALGGDYVAVSRVVEALQTYRRLSASLLGSRWPGGTLDGVSSLTFADGVEAIENPPDEDDVPASRQ